MRKRTVLILSVIILILTFMFAEIFSIYNFGSVPSLLTFLYLISIFSILEYLSISVLYVIRRLIKKEKIETKKVFGLILLFVALLLILSFLIIIDIDWLNWYMYSSPFYINVIIRSIEFLLPSIIFIVVGTLLIKK